MDLTKPPTVVVHRNEPIHGRASFPMETQTYTVAVDVEEAPQPVKQTTFYGVGRDPKRDGRHMTRFQSLAIPEWLSVMGWPFAIAKVPSALVVSMPRGRQNPIRERTNISMPNQTALGDMTAVSGQVSWSPAYAKITF